jgi:hypothetical protein
MASVILTAKHQEVIKKSIWGLSDDDLQSPAMKAAIVKLDAHIN